jgi:hypothetical protein
MTNAQPDKPEWMDRSVARLTDELAASYGEAQRPRLVRGLEQISNYWRLADGSVDVFEAFVRRNFAGDEETLDAMFQRFEKLLEKLNGHMSEIRLAFKEQSDLDTGPILPFDEVFAAYDPSAHVLEDFFENKLAFIVLLNFPLTTLEQRITQGEQWTRRQWAEARLTLRFSKRIPAEVNQSIAEARAVAGQYIAEYNIWMHHLIDRNGNRLFPAKMRLLSHWNLRDEIKAQYSSGEAGLAKQRMIQKVMERIIDQTIPEIVVNNPHVDWNPNTNEVTPAGVNDSGEPRPSGLQVSNSREPDTRYAVLRKSFLASAQLDAYSPTAPTLIDRRFDEMREIPEERVKAMFEQMLTSPLLGKVAHLIEKNLGRPLEPFDIWYNGFRPRGKYTEQELDKICKEKYPTAEAYEKDMPRMLKTLGFSQERAEFLAAKITVDPARGSGHAWGAGMRDSKAHLRTRVAADGMDYKGFNIAVHEMGHNVEQVLSLCKIDHTLLEGVPNTAFTEALAFVFQSRDLELLGLYESDAKAEAMKTLDDYWGACEIAAVSLVDMAIWHWMYDHPDANAAELKDAAVQIAKDIWNEYYAPIFKKTDVILLGVYSHIIQSFLYLPDYPMGHLIAVQVEEQMKKANDLGAEFERMTSAGNIAPDLWMKNATGTKVGAEAMLAAVEKAFADLGVE